MPNYVSPEEQKIEDLKSRKYAEEAPYHPGYQDAAMNDKGYEEKNLVY